MPEIIEPTQQMPSIANMVDYLHNYHSEILDNLRSKYPNQANTLRVGEVWGGKNSNETLQATAAASLEWLDVVVEDCSTYLPVISTRLRTASKFQFVSQLLTTVGSASVLTALAGHFPDGTKLATAVFTLMGSLCTLFAQFLTGSTSSLGGSLLTHHDNLVKYQIEAQLIRRKLKLWIDRGCTGNEGTKLISQGEALCEQAEQIFPKLQLIALVKATT